MEENIKFGAYFSDIPYTLSEKVSKECSNSVMKLIENGDHTFDNSKKALEEDLRKTVDFCINLLKN